MSSSGAATQYKLDANSNAIALITDVAALPPSPSQPQSQSQSPAADRIEWSRATILGFIEDYRRQRVLWDPNTKGYHIKQTKYEALKLLSEKYGTEIRSIRSKIKSLRSSFHREHGKVLNGRNRGVHYQPMWFAYEAIRFILDGEHDADVTAGVGVGIGVGVDGDVEATAANAEAASEADDKLRLMHSLDLEQLTAAAVVGKQQQVVEQQQQQQEEFAARVAAAVAAVAAAAAAANVREQREHSPDADAAASDANSNGCAGAGSDATASTAEAEAEAENEAETAAAAAVSAVVTRSSSDLDGENYCNISAEDVKTEIIEHEVELGLLDRQTSTPLSLGYYKATDLTYNHRKRKAALDEHDIGSDIGGLGVGIVGGVVGALTLTPIKSTVVQQHHHHHHHNQQQQQQQQQQLNHSQIAFHAFQQQISHNLSHNGNHHHHLHHLQLNHSNHSNHLHQQQQHSNNMAQKRDRDRDLSSSPAEAHSLNTNNNNNNNNTLLINHNNNNIHSSTSLELHALNTTITAAATTTATPSGSNSSGSGSNNSSGISSLIATSNNPNNISSSKLSNNSNGNLSANHVDEYGVFGEYVAITIRKLKTAKSKIVVKHLINNLLYEAELGKYDQGMPASKEPPQLYKMQ